MSKIKVFLLLSVMTLALPLHAEEQSGWQTFKGNMKDAGKEMGDTGKAIGHKGKEVGLDIAGGAKKVGKDVKEFFTGKGEQKAPEKKQE